MSAPAGRALRLDGVCRSFGDVRAVHDVSFELADDETIALVGPSGCGKSTLLRVIAGLVPADAGRIELGGQVVDDVGLHAPPEDRHVGFVFQEHTLFPHLTVADNVGFGLGRRPERARVDAMLELVELAGFGGMSDPIPDSSCYFSGAGPTPTGVMKPDLVAPGAYLAGAMSRDADPRMTAGGVFDGVGCPSDLPACHVLDDGHALTTGTSMASPHVAGAIALLFERDPSLTQAELRDLLQAGAHYPHGAVPYEYQLGPGALDLLGTLDVLDAQQAADPDVDPSRSYYVLSSPYARPDPTWPIVGVVQLRLADGSVFVGDGRRRLSLHVDDGEIVEPLTLVRAGMWRFAVAAASGSGGEVLRVDVRYGGVSLGVKALPVGADVWVAQSGVVARGSGCGLAQGRPVGGLWGAVAGLLLWAARRWRRRRRLAAQ